MAAIPHSDWIILAFLGYFSLKNIKKELLSQLASLVGWGLTFYTVPKYYSFVSASNLFNFLTEDYKNTAYKIMVFCITIIVFDFISSIIDTTPHNRRQRPISINLLVMFIGFIKASILISFILNLLDQQNINLEFINSSKIIPYIQHITATINSYVDRLIKLIFSLFK